MGISVINIIDKLDHSSIPDHRKDLLKPLHDYVILKVKQKVEANLNFICTHNSRRSQIAQVWAKIMSDYYGSPSIVNKWPSGLTQGPWLTLDVWSSSEGNYIGTWFQ